MITRRGLREDIWWMIMIEKGEVSTYLITVTYSHSHLVTIKKTLDCEYVLYLAKGHTVY